MWKIICNTLIYLPRLLSILSIETNLPEWDGRLTLRHRFVGWNTSFYDW